MAEVRTRNLTTAEIRRMRMKHLVMIPVFLVCGLIAYVISMIDKIPMPARIAGMAICGVACVIFIVKQIKLSHELKTGEVQVAAGKITKKVKLGGRKGTSSGINTHHNRSQRSASFYIHVDDMSFNVPAKIYSKVNMNDQVELHYFERSKYILDVEIVNQPKRAAYGAS